MLGTSSILPIYLGDGDINCLLHLNFNKLNCEGTRKKSGATLLWWCWLEMLLETRDPESVFYFPIFGSKLREANEICFGHLWTQNFREVPILHSFPKSSRFETYLVDLREDYERVIFSQFNVTYDSWLGGPLLPSLLLNCGRCAQVLNNQVNYIDRVDCDWGRSIWIRAKLTQVSKFALFFSKIPWFENFFIIPGFGTFTPWKSASLLTKMELSKFV